MYIIVPVKLLWSYYDVSVFKKVTIHHQDILKFEFFAACRVQRAYTH